MHQYETLKITNTIGNNHLDTCKIDKKLFMYFILKFKTFSFT